MCYNKIRLKNPAWQENVLWSRKWIYVPCGHCAECRDLMVNSYAFRAQQETHRCQSSNGLVFFNTLTYDDSNLPLLRLKDGSLISTFNKRHIQLFFKRLRKFLSYYYNIDSLSFRYLLTSERGSNRVYQRKKFIKRSNRWITYNFQATERPHYHSIIWLYNSISCNPKFTLPYWCNGYTSLSQVFPLAFKHFWSYGNVDDELICRTPALATKYVCKYVLKQSDDKLCSLDLSQVLNHNQDRYFDYKKQTDIFLDYSNYKPFTLVSKGVGSSFVPTFEHLVGEKKCTFQSSDSKVSEISLPQYFISRFCKFSVKSERKYCRVVADNWSAQSGYVPGRFHVFSDADVRLVPKRFVRSGSCPFKEVVYLDGVEYPVVHHSNTVYTDVGLAVYSKRFKLNVDSVYESIVKFVDNPIMEFNPCFKFNPNIHNEFYSINFFNGNNLFPLLKDSHARQVFRSPEIPESKSPSQSLFYRLLWSYEVLYSIFHYDSLSLTSKYYSYLNYNVCSIDSKFVLKKAIGEYLHNSLDVSQPLYVALDIYMNFCSDMQSIRSAVSKYNNMIKYKSSKCKALEKAPSLFAPHVVEFSNNNL